MKPASPRSNTAFTLIELLVVIAIIAILMGLLFPAINIVKEAANKANAQNDVSSIVTAVKAYNADYGKYPTIEKEAADTESDALCGPKAAGADIDNNELFNTLRAIPEGINGDPKEHFMNPKRIVFFEGRAAANQEQPRRGFLEKQGSDKKGCFYDPWGEQYAVIIDRNGDNKIKVEEQYSDFGSNDEPRAAVGAFSLGKDNKLGKDGDKKYKDGTNKSDDIVSWQ
jgi:prepilin-type N-terminal cleavage/methylation domain-containing protein